eukprot:353222-Chlamydomonas_euryale.AAC.19
MLSIALAASARVLSRSSTSTSASSSSLLGLPSSAAMLYPWCTRTQRAGAARRARDRSAAGTGLVWGAQCEPHLLCTPRSAAGGAGHVPNTLPAHRGRASRRRESSQPNIWRGVWKERSRTARTSGDGSVLFAPPQVAAPRTTRRGSTSHVLYCVTGVAARWAERATRRSSNGERHVVPSQLHVRHMEQIQAESVLHQATGPAA